MACRGTEKERKSQQQHQEGEVEIEKGTPNASPTRKGQKN